MEVNNGFGKGNIPGMPPAVKALKPSRRGVALKLPPLEGSSFRMRSSDAVFEHLKEVIRGLELLPGTAISEAGITESLGVGRSPVREALARLVDLGLVSVIPQVGGRIAPISIRQVEEAVFIRSSLEIGAFKRAITGAAPDTSEIQKLVDENSKAAAEGNMELFFETDEQLHQKVFELAGMARIWEVVRGTKVQLDRLRQLNLPLSVKNLELFDEHQAIVDALRSQDMELGITTIHRHSTRIFETVEELRSVYPSYFAP
jgi:DNA-binding GntR family transcriptional regulator